MPRILFRALVVFVAILGAVALVGLLLPSRFRVERSIVVQAQPEKVYPLVASFRTGWAQWSPFGTRADKDMTVTFSGPDEGIGAKESWTGGNTPPGSMEIVRAHPRSGVDYRLLMNGGALAMDGRLSLSPVPGGTRITWVDEGEMGPNPLRHLVGKVLETMIGRGFEQGLATLKEKVEAGHQPPEAQR
jgi:Polyketide cyclase / dehydrase and lipid transport